MPVSCAVAVFGAGTDEVGGPEILRAGRRRGDGAFRCREARCVEAPAYSQLTPDGTRLLAISDKVQVWDLRVVRVGLLDPGLGWNAPDFPAANPAAPPRVWIDMVR